MDGLWYLEMLLNHDVHNETRFQNSILTTVLPEVKESFKKTTGELRDLMNAEPNNPVYQMSAMNMSIGWTQLEKICDRYERNNVGMPCIVIPSNADSSGV